MFSRYCFANQRQAKPPCLQREKGEIMAEILPSLPIDQELLKALIAALLVYQRFRKEKTPPTEERLHTLLILHSLIPKLYTGVDTRETALPLWLTVDDVQVIKAGLAALLDNLNRKSASARLKKEMQNLKELQVTIEKTFRITQD